MSDYTIGVIIPAYNARQTLGSALASIATQSRQPEMIVVVDDASTDDTVEVARRWCGRLPITLIVHERNRGVGAARRTAAEALDSDLIAILDADDYWLPDHLELMEAHYKQYPGLVCANALRWAPDGALNLTPWQAEHPISSVSDQFEALLHDNFVFMTTMFARSDYEAAGGYDDTLRIAEDWDLWLRLVARGVRVTALRQPTMLYRLHDASLTADAEIAPAELDVLRGRGSLGDSDRRRRQMHRAEQLRRASMALTAAYDAADLARWRAARRNACHALIGTSPVRRRALALLLAPRLVSGLRRRRHSGPSWRVHQ